LVLLANQQWAERFEVTPEDVDTITGYLLETETPLTTEEITRVLIQNRIDEQKAAFASRYEGTQVYDPASAYVVGQRLSFPQFEYATAEVTTLREGENPALGTFSVIGVQFDDTSLNPKDHAREFAAAYSLPHRLNLLDGLPAPVNELETLDEDEILRATDGALVDAVEDMLTESPALIRLSSFWFVRELVMDVDIGHLHLAEAVLDMHQERALATNEILAEIGGLGDAPAMLQEFSLNLAMQSDGRFDEVGPSGAVRWFLRRMQPELVTQAPPAMVYRTLSYDPELLTPDQRQVEEEISDELTRLPVNREAQEGRAALIYPHRRHGTLPLNRHVLGIVPSARTPRIWVEFVDAQDGERFPGWVVHEHGYALGLADFYRKYRLPVGTLISVRQGKTPDQLVVDHHPHRAQTEWIRLAIVNKNRLTFENTTRVVDAAYDEHIILGIEDLAEIDTLVATIQRQNRTLLSLIRELVEDLSQESPQGTVHFKTLYSALNILRRCPPGPILATLEANPEFEDVGDAYWKIRE
jgi:hypothetical protein